MLQLKIKNIDIEEIKEYKNNPKIHDKHQVYKIVDSINQFGFNNPILVDENHEIIAGHGRFEAIKLLGYKKVPTIVLKHLSEEEKKAYRIADNKLTEIGKWDFDLLSVEFKDLSKLDLDFDIDITGFETGEIDLIINDTHKATSLKEDNIPNTKEVKEICKKGDIWQLGKHYLICDDALNPYVYEKLMKSKKANMVLTDPPYNVKVKNIGSLGKIKHKEFAMASGEMSSEEFKKFLEQIMSNLKNNSENGALHYIFMDWKHSKEIILAADGIYDELKNICIWNKTNGGMGSFYRSKHEMCFIYKSGKERHINNIELGRYGRYRTNVWDYQGVNCFGSEKDNLQYHPTVKPVAMLKDAILDVTKRNQIVLDAFLGSGSTLIACEQIGRICYGIELEEMYCNVAIHRWEELTNNKAVKLEV